MATASKSQERLKEASQGLVGALSNRALGAAEDKVGNLTSKMESMAQEGGLSMPKLAKPVVKSAVGSGASAVKDKVGDAASGLGEKVKDAVTGGSKKSGSNIKVTTILETIDVGVPIELAYNQWTEFGSFPSFMKKVEVVDAVEDQKLKWKAQIFWSHREWESTILDQRPEERIIWRSKGKKGLGRRRGDLPRARARADPDHRGAGVPPPGALRAHRQPVARPGPPGPRRAAPLPAPRDVPRPARSRLRQRLARRDRGRRGRPVRRGAARGGGARPGVGRRPVGGRAHR
ncbi:SRPBCC family protein [Nocardioides sp. TF02-7]|uniref:SRPBCC family protein n=1 Tax=Nocardioides sp. TF02-7 TaxID=2917724 RepID=UPI001F06A2A0|nr:SRPBCC family protein [Nocardioides sp. TF02-7]UMG94346.1 hypothetical protein MF408_10280 [Nocardioides sp. TF02-7]